jgi:hypothetical protein
MHQDLGAFSQGDHLRIMPWGKSPREQCLGTRPELFAHFPTLS